MSGSPITAALAGRIDGSLARHVGITRALDHANAPTENVEQADGLLKN